MSVTRRRFLSGSALSLAAVPLADLVRPDDLWAAEQAARQTAPVFRHGVASGDPRADRVLLWTRVSGGTGEVPVRWTLAANPTFTRVIARGETRTGAARDFTVKVDATGLAPATTYYYRFEALGGRSAVGRTRTLPAAGAARIRMALTSCSNYPHGYFNAYARMKKKGLADKLVICVPSGNFGNITAGLFGHEMGLPIHRFIAANNANDIFYEYLQTGKYNPQPSKQTIANAMDVGDPSNFARIYDLYKGDHDAIAAYIGGATYKDEQIAETMKQCYNETKYVLDPHGACGYRALKEQLKPGEVGVFLETAHPAKFKEKVDSILDSDIEIPARLAEFMKGEKKSIQMTKDIASFKNYLMNE